MKSINETEDMNDKEDIIENEITSDNGNLLDNDNALSGDEDLGKKKDFFSLSTSAKEKKKASINFYSYEFDHILKGDKDE